MTKILAIDEPTKDKRLFANAEIDCCVADAIAPVIGPGLEIQFKAQRLWEVCLHLCRCDDRHGRPNSGPR